MTDKKDAAFFIGWADTPPTDRRFFLRAGLGLTAGAAVMAAGLAAFQTRPGPGAWNQGAIRDFTGVVTAEPYAMLRTLDIDGAPKTALLACLGKCGVAARIGALAGQSATVRGSLIQRGPHAMIAVVDGPDWIQPAPNAAMPTLAFPTPKPLTQINLVGEILDSKCWFGAMRPSEGKVHKSCASLCIRGGIPPAFFARDRKGGGALMIMTSNGAAHDEEILPLVADPVRVQGSLSRLGDILLLDAPARSITRL